MRQFKLEFDGTASSNNTPSEDATQILKGLNEKLELLPKVGVYNSSDWPQV